MTHIDPGKAVQPRMDPGEDVEISTTRDRQVNEDKAKAIIRILTAANLKQEYRFDPEEAAVLWAAKLAPFSFEVLSEAARAWIDSPDKEFPTLGQLETQARYVHGQNERERIANDSDQAHTYACEECGVWGPGDGPVLDEGQDTDVWVGNLHWIRVEIPESKRRPGAADHYMRPCPRCLPERARLFDAGHWREDHIAGGGCSQCRHYHWPWKYKDPRVQRGKKVA